jgi:hypothetical protein
MTMNLLRACLAGAAVALFAPLGWASAQDIQYASHAELNDLYSRLAELESRVAATNVSGCGHEGHHDSCWQDECCGCPGIVAGAEILFLKAYHGDGDFGDFNFDDGYRFWVGYQAAGGLGVRFRYFDFENEADNGDIVDITHADFEIFDAVQLGCNWDLIVAGGVRYVDTYHNDGEGDAADDVRLFGPGPTISAELVRHVTHRAALYGIFRESIIVGDLWEDDVEFEDSTMAITEIQLGGQLNYEWRGALLFGRAGWEAQYYHDLADDNETPLALMGAVFGAGIMR